ncbi:MAG: hypothetical protein HOP00_01375 [Nitrospira sp.]|nr:hypothetical protein [Nitrospira sp.]
MTIQVEQLLGLLERDTPSIELLQRFEAVAYDKPLVACELASAIARTPTERHQWMIAIMSVWSQADPEAAWGWVCASAVTRGVTGEKSLSAVIFDSVAGVDPQRVLDWVESASSVQGKHPNLGIPMHLLKEEAVSALLLNDRGYEAKAAVEKWARSGTGQAIDTGAITGVAKWLNALSPATAATWLTGMPASEATDHALLEVLSSWSAIDPSTAMEWTKATTEGLRRSDSMRLVMNQWAMSDSVGAAGWLAADESDMNSDQLVSSFSERLVAYGGTPEIAQQWASLIVDNEKRSATLTEIVLNWGMLDPQSAALNVSDSAYYTVEQKNRLLRWLAANRNPNSSL